MRNKLDVIYRIVVAALAAALAVLIISPIAAPVSDTYLLTSGSVTLVLMVAAVAIWFMKRK